MFSLGSDAHEADKRVHLGLGEASEADLLRWEEMTTEERLQLMRSTAREVVVAVQREC